MKRESQLDYLLKAYFEYMYDQDRSRVKGLSFAAETVESRLMTMGVNHKKQGGAWASNKETIVRAPTTPIFYRDKDIRKINNLLVTLPLKVQEYCRARYKIFMVGKNGRYLKIKEIQFRMKYPDAKTFYNHRQRWEQLITKKFKKAGIL